MYVRVVDVGMRVDWLVGVGVRWFEGRTIVCKFDNKISIDQKLQLPGLGFAVANIDKYRFDSLWRQEQQNCHP